MTALPLRRQTPAAVPGRLVSIDSESAIYRDGSYLKNNPSWHIEESPFKVRQIQRMMKRQKLAPKTVCDVGCGAGLVLAELQPHLPSDCRLLGLRCFSRCACHEREARQRESSLSLVRHTKG